MQLNTFLDQGQNIFALESPLTERDSILAELSKRDHPVYYWNPAHTHLQIFKDGTLSDHKEIPQGEVETTLFCDDGVETPGIFLLEGVFTTLAPFFWVNKAHAFRNARSEQYLILSDPAVELEEEIKGLIPTACNTVPSSEEMTDWLQLHLGRTPDRRLVMACAGLFFGDLGHVLKGLLTQNPDDESLVSSINAYKVSQLSSRGLESMGDPDVKVGGLDLLEKYIDDRVKLFTPEARAYNIRQPRGIILWGLPGTGKSLTTKHAATRMGIPLLATEWGQILDEDTAKAAANLRYVLQVAEACSPCIMAWDDFEKMPLGAMAGILLTWMQERTKPVYLIASINRLSKLPPELIRPGRFDTIFFVEPPHEGARKEIFSIHLEKHQVDTSSYTTMDWHKLISAYGRCTAAEIANAVKTAAEDVFCAKKPTVVTPEDLLFQRTLFEPSLIREEEALLGELKMAKNTRSACSPDNSEWKLQPSPMFKAMLG